MIVSNKNYIFLVLLFVSLGNIIFQFLGLLVLIVLFYNQKRRFSFLKKDLFYLIMVAFSLSQIFFVWRNDYSLPYVTNTFISSFLWGIMFLASFTVSQLIKKTNAIDVNEALNNFFYLNVIFMAVQYTAICFELNTLFPHYVSMSSGDKIMGVFTNSSVAMIVFSFYSIYFFYIGERSKLITAFIACLATTYMSGIVIFMVVISFMVVIRLKAKNIMKGLLIITAMAFLFYKLSPNNVDYVQEVIFEKVLKRTDDSSRKITSFQQTLNYLFSSPNKLIFGSGGGKFSSRTAFVTAGEYVSWYPEKYQYKSNSFKENHFSLWNNKILSIPFKDGTANQPFSFYNKLFGEYGLLGFTIFALFYIQNWISRYNKLTYGKPALYLMLSYFILDYWFEYITVIIFFEVFLSLDLKTQKELRNE